MSLLINPYRFASVFDPLTSIPWHSVLWADNPAQSLTDGAAVSSWTNSGSLGVAAQQATSTKRPIFRASVAGLNGRAALEFDTSNDDLLIPTFTAIAPPYSVFMIISRASTSDSKAYACLQATSPGSTSRLDQVLSSARLAAGGSFSLYPTTISTGAALLAGVWNGASSKLISGATQTTGDPGAIRSADTLGLNSNVANSGSWAGGHRAFVGLYEGDLTAHARWADLKAWAAAYYTVAT